MRLVISVPDLVGNIPWEESTSNVYNAWQLIFNPESL